MATVAAQTYITPQEYLTLERKAAYKSEYLDGHIIAMSGASFKHSLIISNISGELHLQFKGRGCSVHTNDMRVRPNPRDSYFYPDVVVVCGEPQFEDEAFDTLLNPIVIVEVLSPSTEAYDRGEKFRRYQQLASLKEYVLVSQDKVWVEHHRRHGAQWILSHYRSFEEVLPLPSIGCEVPLRDIYARVILNED
ncbi:hypothetical protein C6495_16225 [Candidatus Poribacteria bacterium]|nr:MAG: hypothetical protein C6495_16225 [Candidatus Poribacteria bacterium]